MRSVPGLLLATLTAAALGGTVAPQNATSTYRTDRTETTLNWRGRLIDPEEGDLAVPTSLAADDSNELFYVQFVTDVVDAYAAGMRRLGASFVRYHPNRAYVVRIARDRIGAVEGLSYVRAVMELAPAHKLDEDGA
jgi:hypothetical protein